MALGDVALLTTVVEEPITNLPHCSRLAAYDFLPAAIHSFLAAVYDQANVFLNLPRVCQVF